MGEQQGSALCSVGSCSVGLDWGSFRSGSDDLQGQARRLIDRCRLWSGSANELGGACLHGSSLFSTILNLATAMER